MLPHIKFLGAVLVTSWVIFEGVGWARNPYRTLGFPPPGHADVRHDVEQLKSIGLKEGMSRNEVTARLHALGFRTCFIPEDKHMLSCRWDYREFPNPFEITWILEIQFTADVAREITSVTGYGYEDV